MNNNNIDLKKLINGEDIDDVITSQNGPKPKLSKDEEVDMVIDSTKVPNKVLREMVRILKDQNTTQEDIINRLLFFDELAEKGELIDYIKKHESGAEKLDTRAS